MPKTVQVEGTGLVEFPDEMSDDDISVVLKKQSQPSSVSPLERNARADYQSSRPQSLEENISATERMAKNIPPSQGVHMPTQFSSGVANPLDPQSSDADMMRAAAPKIQEIMDMAMTPIVRPLKGLLNLGIRGGYRLAGGDGAAPDVDELIESPESPPDVKVVAGATSSLADFGDFFASPVGIATLGTGALPKAAQKMVGAAFAASMIEQAPHLAEELGTELGKPEDQRDLGKIAKLTADVTLNTVLPVAIAKHIGSSAWKSPKEIQKGQNAIRIEEATEVHGDVQPQPLEGAGKMPIKEGGEGVQPQAEGGIPKAEGTGDVSLTPEVEQFGKDFNGGKILTTHNAVATGMKVKTIADLEALLKTQGDQIAKGELDRSELESKLDKAKTMEEKEALFKEMFGKNPQLPREAIETATNTGSHIEGEGTIPSKYGERPLDWRKNPEVRDWLLKHGEELWRTPKSGEENLSRKLFNEEAAKTQPKSPNEKAEKTQAAQAEVLTSPEMQPEGMGAMAAGELEPPKPFKTSNKNATVDAERKARGLPPMMQAERQSNQAAWDEAMRAVDENPRVQDELITELASEPRAVTPTENAMLMHRRIDLRNEYEKALHRWREAFEGDDFVRAAEESQRVKDWSSKLSDLEDITKTIGTESGRSLQARKMMANEDFTLAAMELRAMQAKGRHLTPEEHIQLIKAQEKIAALEVRLNELESTRETKEVTKETDSTMADVAREAPKEARSKDFDIDREENLVGQIKAKIDKGQLNDITSLVQQLARVLWRRGVRKRDAMIDELHATLKTIVPEFTRDQTQRAFSGYGNFKPLSKESIDVGLRDLRGQTQQVLKLEALEARRPLEKTGQERRTPTDEERRLIKQVNELKRKYGVVVTDSATQLKSALAARKTYYEHRIADLKHEIATRDRIVKTKTPSPTDAALQALIAERDRLQAEHDTIFPRQEMTDAQRLKLALAAAERNQAHWQTSLENAKKGIFDKRAPGTKVTSAELEAIKARTEEIKDHVQELKDLANPKKTPAEIALQSLKTRMKTRTADYMDRLAKGDFAKRERKPVALDAEGNRIKAELDLAKDAFNAGLERDRWKNMSVFQKGKRIVADTYDAARALMTTGEFSFILRQGKLAALSHPIQTAKALPSMFRALLSNEQKAHEIDLAVHNHPDAPAARAAKLHLVDEGVSLHKQEEIMMGRWVGKIPVVKNFNRAAQVFLNRVRFDMWRAMRKSMSKSGTPTLAEDRQIAMFVNEATGRGGLGKVEPAAVALGRAMFSPRYYISRWQLAAGHSLWGGTMRTRRIIATEYARALIGLSLYYTALGVYFSGDKNNGTLETDPRSTDFGKVKVGSTRLDPLAGLSQAIVLASRTATGEKKTIRGEIQPIRGQVPFGGDKWSDIVASHLRGKLHPVPASIANLFDGTDLGGSEATLVNQAGNLIAPITYVDIYAALKEQDLPDGVALALLALLGEGLQTYKRE